MTKRIGFQTARLHDGSIGIPSAYVEFIALFGTPVPIFALDEKVHEDIDLLILTGGADINPERYDSKPSLFAQNSNPLLEWFDTNMLPQYINAGIPVFGICRGFQTLNVLYGGAMNQHIAQDSSSPRSQLVHDVLPTQYTNEMFSFLGINSTRLIQHGKPTKFKVNSLHHQGLSTLGKGIRPIYTNPGHGNIEAIWLTGSKVVGVQWHPEEIYDDFSLTVINTLIKSR